MSFKPDISVDVCGKHFKNPVIAASGAYGFGEDYTDLLSAVGTRRYFLQGYDLK